MVVGNLPNQKYYRVNGEKSKMRAFIFRRIKNM